MSLRETVLVMISALIRARYIHKKGLSWDWTVRLKGLPVIDVRAGGRLLIGQYVTLNSWNHGSHVSMFGPVKLIADRPDALIRIGAHTRINGACLHAYESIKVGERCLIAPNCQIFDGSGHDLCFHDPTQRIGTRGSSKPIEIEDDVWIGANSIILPGAHIGRGSVIGAGSVVTGTIPPMTLAAGNPAVVKRTA